MVTSFLLLLIGIIILSAAALVLVQKFPRLKIYFQTVFLVLIGIFGYLLFESIMTPIRFNKDVKVRYDAAVVNLKEIRKLEETFKDKYGRYCGSFDSLISFWKYDSISIPKLTLAEGKLWNQDEMTKKQALEAGILLESENFIFVKDSIFTPDYKIDEIRYIPYSEGKEFSIGAGEVTTGSQIKIKVFEAYCLFDDLIGDMDKQLVINYKDDKFKITNFYGIKVGSLEEANNNAGNWEK